MPIAPQVYTVSDNGRVPGRSVRTFKIGFPSEQDPVVAHDRRQRRHTTLRLTLKVEVAPTGAGAKQKVQEAEVEIQLGLKASARQPRVRCSSILDR